MEGSVSAAEDLGAPPESWEVADLDASVRRLMLSSSNDSSAQCDLTDSSSASAPNSESASSSSAPASGVPEDVVNSVDQFLREALQNPRERLSGIFFFLNLVSEFLHSICQFSSSLLCLVCAYD